MTSSCTRTPCQVGIVDGKDHNGAGDWLLGRLLYGSTHEQKHGCSTPAQDNVSRCHALQPPPISMYSVSLVRHISLMSQRG
jgi:hypothetical protein